MLYKYFTEKILGLQGILIENIEEIDNTVHKLVKCAKAMQNWLTGILNSFTTPITNGFIEGCNNKIKVLKRNAYGYRNFKRFRNRILHMFSDKHIFSTEKQATV